METLVIMNREDQIRLVAYYKWLNNPNSDPLENWLYAEKEHGKAILYDTLTCGIGPIGTDTFTFHASPCSQTLITFAPNHHKDQFVKVFQVSNIR